MGRDNGVKKIHLEHKSEGSTKEEINAVGEIKAWEKKGPLRGMFRIVLRKRHGVWLINFADVDFSTALK